MSPGRGRSSRFSRDPSSWFSQVILVILTAIMAWLVYSLLVGSLNLEPVREGAAEILDGDLQVYVVGVDVALSWAGVR